MLLSTLCCVARSFPPVLLFVSQHSEALHRPAPLALKNTLVAFGLVCATSVGVAGAIHLMSQIASESWPLSCCDPQASWPGLSNPLKEDLSFI